MQVCIKNIIFAGLVILQEFVEFCAEKPFDYLFAFFALVQFFLYLDALTAVTALFVLHDT